MNEISSYYDLWRTAKTTLQFDGLISPNGLHLGLGLMIYAGLCILFRNRPHPYLYALIGLIGLQIVNELVDFTLAAAVHRPVDTLASGLDIAFSVTLPIVLTIVLYRRRRNTAK